MSMRYSVNVVLWQNYSQEMVYKILEKGQHLGFKYEIHNQNDFKAISLNGALNFFLEAELPYLLVTYENTSFAMGIIKSGLSLHVSFIHFGEGWKKNYLNENEQEFDIQRYAKLMLDLIGDYKIFEFKIELN